VGQREGCGEAQRETKRLLSWSLCSLLPCQRSKGGKEGLAAAKQTHRVCCISTADCDLVVGETSSASRAA